MKTKKNHWKTGKINGPKGSRWMIVDDNADILWLMEQLLTTRVQADICCFTNGSDALAALQADPESFIAVITDCDMPGMNGFELCRRIHAIAPELPVALSTGSREVSESEAVVGGFRMLFRKPFGLA